MIFSTKEVVSSALKHWQKFPTDIFTQILNTKVEISLVKFRNVIGERQLVHEVKPFQGIKLIDVGGPRDYFVGEIIIVKKKYWNIISASFTIVLFPKFRLKKPKKMKKVRDDGFLKIYHSRHNSLVITII